jgi:hypothetical protein
VADEEFDGTDVGRQLFGEREGIAHQTGNTLPQGVIEAFGVIGFARFLRDGSVPLRRNHTRVGFILVRMKRGLFPLYRRDLGPQLLGTLMAAIPDVKRNDLAGGSVYAIQIHCLSAFFCTKLHISSDSASSCRSTTVVGTTGS